MVPTFWNENLPHLQPLFAFLSPLGTKIPEYSKEKRSLSRPTSSAPSSQSVDILCLINSRIMQINAPGTAPIFPQSFINIPKPLENCYSSLAKVNSSLWENQNSSLAKGYSPPGFHIYLCEEKGFDYETFFLSKIPFPTKSWFLWIFQLSTQGLRCRAVFHGCSLWIFSWKPQSWFFHGKRPRLNVRDGLYREFWEVVMRIWLFPIQRSQGDSQISKGISFGCFQLGIRASPAHQGIVGIKSYFYGVLVSIYFQLFPYFPAQVVGVSKA